ncbi:MAG TPA: amino acid--[acyl-carrier-protein] ligase [Ilumatobacteraceae bacterium]|nr:amino acid--[acyl-carrier-protein] ligase [Ilumatobacteraceae bacterium]
MSPEELVKSHLAMRDRLFAAGLLIPTGADGVYGRSAEFEKVIAGLKRAVRAAGLAEHAVELEFPPLLPKKTFDSIGYLRNFPQLCGAVFSFRGGEPEYASLLKTLDGGEPYAHHLSQSDLALTPACCYPVYPTLQNQVLAEAQVFETSQYCFRHEPSQDPMRLQAFRMIEHIRVGTPDDVLDWRELWLERTPALLTDLGLQVGSDVANDAFFGRAGRLLSMSQREQQLKIEFLIPVFGDEHPTACASINYHQDHFGELFEIRTPSGELAHSSCVGFGLERCTVALFAEHGMSIDSWPAAVRTRLWG